MKQLIPNLEMELLIENGGHQMKMTGSGRRFTATFASLSSLAHFGLRLRKLRRLIPAWASVHVEWRGLRIPVRNK